MAHTISTSIHIAASPALVWRTLTNFTDYGWNPFISMVAGDLAVGGRLRVAMSVDGKRTATFKPVILRVEPERELVWRGSLPIPGLFVGEHRFRLQASGVGTTFNQSETFTGLLIPLLGGTLRQTEQAFSRMDEALKRRCEKLGA